MKIAISTVAFVLSFSAFADTTRTPPEFAQGAPLETLLESLPSTSTIYPWLPDVTARRYTGAIEAITMANVRENFLIWCKAQGARILTKDRSCFFASGGNLDCPAGEMLSNKGLSDFEVGMTQTAKNNNENFEFGWPKAPYVVPKNALAVILGKQNERTVVGDMQRCIDNDKRIVAIMLFSSIGKGNDLLFMGGESFDAIAKAGVAAKKSALDSIKPGDRVLHKRNNLKRGMVIEVKPPLAQIQWDGRNGAAAITEWSRIDDLEVPR